MILLHATSVCVAGQGVLIRGPSGSGKSDLALRLLDGGARLIADDQTRLERQGESLWASAPETIAGMLEVRGLGVVPVGPPVAAPVTLVVDLVGAERIERMPEPDFTELEGVRLPRLDLAPFQASAPAKLRLAMRGLSPTERPS